MLIEVFRKQIDIYKQSSKRNYDKEILTHYYFFRPISFFLTTPLILLRLSPNAATCLNLLVLFISCGSIFFINNNSIFLSSLGFLFFYSFDFVDGNLARYFSKASILGKNLDGSIDLLGRVYFLFLGIYWMPIDKNTGILSILYCAVYFYLQYVKLRFQTALVSSVVTEALETDKIKSGMNRLKYLYFNVSETLPLALPVSIYFNFYFELICFYMLSYMLSSYFELSRLLKKLYKIDTSGNL